MKKNIIYGKNPVQNTILHFSHEIKEIYIQKGFAFDNEVFNVIKNNNIKWTSLEKQEFNNLIQEKINHQGIFAEIKDYKYSDLKDIISKNETKSTILVLDRIQDPNNFGAIIRTATLFGVNGIIILDHNQVEVTPAVIKASAGTIYNIAIVKVSNLSNALNTLKSYGYWTYCSNISDESQDITKIAFDNKSAIILGNEGEGVMKKLISQSDFNFIIPTNNTIDSLNVSVATGIILFARSLNE
ncbi:23S rRNA (guanosine(2251)-2'-O)-methyltransferase RlmB [Spiroplasma culicicola]|uniref:tRNA/rRNA methyltransferase n=1 Tax=Spiroplasma culicicola AES-1 TaxID=1276246 RepID=W6A5G7_9MOLU|nr:23S rRNA (guanosine(2251)-2'-O)-methyltransferase RlmB [Spiroplasma culicicola]AHI52373.1 tRNA/rRNA methyltransferase [Spiroplasma culicicola AES-1]